MIELIMPIDGVEKTFKKQTITIYDSILISTFQALSAEKAQETTNLDKHNREVQIAFIKLFVDLFKDEITFEQICQADEKYAENLQKCYLQCLNYGSEEVEDDEKK